MIRVIVRSADRGAAANVGGPVDVEYRTFDIEVPELESFLHQPKKENWTYTFREVIGVEVAETPKEKG